MVTVIQSVKINRRPATRRTNWFLFNEMIPSRSKAVIFSFIERIFGVAILDSILGFDKNHGETHTVCLNDAGIDIG